MRQEQFEQQHRARWDEFVRVLEALEKKRRRKGEAAPDTGDLPQLYRLLCQHLAQAQSRNYGAALVERLNDWVLRAHHQLYVRRDRFRDRIIRFVLAGFPRLVRREWRVVVPAILLLALPALFAYLAVRLDPRLVYSLFDPSQVADYESMYNPHLAHIGQARASDTNIEMFGFYIFHNIAIAFRCFASGLFLMIGAVIELVFNGLVLGGLSAHMQNVGYHQTFFPFIIGHGAFELTATALAGAAGLRLGAALVMPGNRTRLAALREAARVGVSLLYGVTGMLVIAASLEAFWSSNNALPNWYKYAAGAFFWSMVTIYFLYAGRRRAP